MDIYEQAKEFANKYLETAGKNSDVDCSFPKKHLKKWEKKVF